MILFLTRSATHNPLPYSNPPPPTPCQTISSSHRNVRITVDQEAKDSRLHQDNSSSNRLQDQERPMAMRDLDPDLDLHP